MTCHAFCWFKSLKQALLWLPHCENVLSEFTFNRLICLENQLNHNDVHHQTDGEKLFAQADNDRMEEDGFKKRGDLD